MGYDVGAWESFALAHVGAAAALVGLVAIALSINLTRIMTSPKLINRAAECVIQLSAILAAAAGGADDYQTLPAPGV